MPDQQPTNAPRDQAPHRDAAQPPAAFRCRVCGTGFRAAGPKAAASCPACGADKPNHLHAPGGAVDYILADRTHGTTSDDITFAQWAKWCGYVTRHQYDLGIHRQNSEMQEVGAARPIHEVMIANDLISRKDAESLLRFMALPRPDACDEDIIRRLIQRGKADEQTLRESCDLQRRMASTRNEVPPITQVLLRKSVVSEVDLLEVLQEQAAEGTGALRMAWAMKGPRVTGGLLARSSTRRALRQGAVIAALAAVILGILWQIFYEPPVKVYGKCNACGHISLVAVPRLPQTWPVKCLDPVCGYRDVRPAYKCPCGEIFTRENIGSLAPCPSCGRTIEPCPLTKDDLPEE